MNISEMFGVLEEYQPIPEEQQMTTTSSYEPMYRDTPMAFGPKTNWDWEDTFKTALSPVLYNVDRYMSPYASNNWGNTTGILSVLSDESRLPSLEEKIDPNRIFNSDLVALQSLAADQQKIVKLFDRQLTDSLNEKGKVGLTEEDIEAMQALTAARSAITTISKEKASIKKSIAELKIKQQQNSMKANAAAMGQDGVLASPISVGRSIMDTIFETGGNVPSQGSYSAPSYNDAMMDNIDPNGNMNNLQYENMNTTTYVVLGDTDDDVSFETYTEDGRLLPDYPNPTSIIEKIDRDAMIAVDDLMVQYPIKNKDEVMY